MIFEALRHKETMSDNANTISSKQDIQSKVIKALETMTMDWDIEIDGGINAETRLIEDLQFESIDIVQFIVVLEQSIGRKDIPFENLFLVEGDYVDDILVSSVVDFLDTQLRTSAT
jgi:acyl carrier protein